MAIRSRFVRAALAAFLVLPATALAAEAVEGLNAVDDSYRTPVNQQLNVPGGPEGIHGNDTLLECWGFSMSAFPSHGTMTIPAVDGSFTYTPDADFSGVDSFKYTLRNCDTGEFTPDATVTIRVEAVDAVDDTYSVNVGETLTVGGGGVAGNDTRPGSYTTALVDNVDHGVLNFDPITSNFTYTPDSGFAGADTFTYRLSNANHPASNDVGTVTINIVAPDTTVPSVTVTAPGSPTSSSPVVFDVEFSESVTGFGDDDVELTGPSGATSAVVAGSGRTYTVTVSGMSATGPINVQVKAGAATDGTNASTASNTASVHYVHPDSTSPTVTIAKGSGQADPTSASPIVFDVVFSEVVTGFGDTGVELSGTAGATTANVSGSGTTYTVSVSGMTSSGTVVAKVKAGAAVDASSNPNTESGTASVTYEKPPTCTIGNPNATTNQTLQGGDGADVICGGLGRDTITGGDGNDIITGGGGNDSVRGGAGDDSISGGVGNDSLHGEDGTDTLNGEAGKDNLTGGNGADTMLGGADNDNLRGGTGNDTINGEDGDDIIYGNNGNDTMVGGAGNDTMSGGAGNDTINGEDGIDNIIGNHGSDTCDGGAGEDVGGSGCEERTSIP